MANDNVFQSADIKSHELFYKIPQIFSFKPYEKLSIRAEKLYGVLLWKISNPAAKSDNIGVYCHATIDELEILLKCSNRLAIQTKKELSDFGLIVEKRQYNGPNKIYLRKLDKGDVSDVLPHDEKSSLKVTKSHNVSDEKSSLKVTKSHSIKNIKKYKEYKEIDSTAIGGENNRQTTLIGADLSQSVGRPIGWSGIQSYLESQSLALSPKQIGELEDFMEIDGLEKSLIEKAIDITAGETGSKRKYNYLKGILTNWKNGNIKTVADQEANEAEREKTPKRIFKNKRLQEKWDNYDDSNDLF